MIKQIMIYLSGSIPGINSNIQPLLVNNLAFEYILILAVLSEYSPN